MLLSAAATEMLEKEEEHGKMEINAEIMNIVMA